MERTQVGREASRQGGFLDDVFVTAMVCALTRLTPSGSLGTEIADYFADFGVGQPSKRVVYTDPARGPRA